VFLILSLTKLREKVAKEVPEALKIGIQAAVGTLIVFIGLRGAGFVVANPSTYIAMGSLKNPPVLLTMLGLLLTPVASVLAFIDPGLAKDENCEAMLAEEHDATAGPGAPPLPTEK